MVMIWLPSILFWLHRTQSNILARMKRAYTDNRVNVPKAAVYILIKHLVTIFRIYFLHDFYIE